MGWALLGLAITVVGMVAVAVLDRRARPAGVPTPVRVARRNQPRDA